ncbi:hypothetical protein BDV34DRAFT_128926 [Aspergillus parasiticus]|uniref:CCHC-type domain-containing protein n=1 Tax=Aspergillus parasiticus TaxID=5067 RepID=A0A5N6DES0_ASPPA|nr:hypothetical protein BDV34DRAFT_128926 [Aspergillus parasiticus]
MPRCALRLSVSATTPGHESSSCPRPRTTETKQCYNCQGLGHVQADCPTLRLNGANGRCYNCSQPGHLARNCPAPASGAGRGVGAPRGGFNGGFRGGYGGYPRAATCYKCGGPNHFARDCQAQAMKCYACGKLVRPHLSGLHRPQRWPLELCWQGLLQVCPGWPHLPGLP